MIPKIIHYCWMSGEPFPELIQKCMDSWKEKLPEYEIICWDSKRFDVNSCLFTKEAYEAKKYAFVSDYIRLYALYNYGGIYLDSDIEVLKTFNDLLENKAFTSFENKYSIAAWIFGSEKKNPIFKEFLEYYKDRPFILEDGSFDTTPNPYQLTDICVKHGLILNGEFQVIENMTIYPEDYFCPYNRASEELNITSNTYTIHYFNGAWIPEKKRKIIENRKKVIKKYGKIVGYIYYAINILRDEGYRSFLKEARYFLKKY